MFGVIVYVLALSVAYMKEEMGKIACEYLDSLSVEQLATKENWDLILSYVNDLPSVPLKLVMAEREKFYALAGKEAVDGKFEKSILTAVTTLAGWYLGKKTPFEEKGNKELMSYLQQIDLEVAPAGLALYPATYARKRDFRGLAEYILDISQVILCGSGLFPPVKYRE